MYTEKSAFMADDKEIVKREIEVINMFFEELEKSNFTIQQTKNIVSRINARITSASITCDMRTPFKKELAN